MYDQNEKAGNRGDVVKHPALMAALGTVLDGSSVEREFLFADLFAGFSHYSLTPSSGEWEEGIGKLGQIDPRPTFDQAFLQNWFDWYVRRRPSLQYGTYPGSSVVALDVAQSLERTLRVAAWDTAPSAVADLMNTLGQGQHSVRTRPADPGDYDVQDANFLFIDPPRQNDWSKVKRFLRKNSRNVLVWLPLHVKDKTATIGAPADKARDWALQRGYSVTRVRWDHHSTHTQVLVGCQLIYSFNGNQDAVNALQAAVSEVGNPSLWAPSWTIEHRL